MDYNDIADNLRKLSVLNSDVQQVVSNACANVATNENSDNVWSSAYDLVFSPVLSQQVHTVLKALGQRLDYYDPDSSYEDDVMAFAQALQDKQQELASLFRSDPDAFSP